MFDLIKNLQENFVNPVLIAIPFFLLLILLESYLSYREKSDNYSGKDTAASLSLGIGSAILDLFTKSIAFAIFGWLYLRFGFFKESLSFSLLGWVLLFFLDDFIFYWHHRLSHQIRLLWAAHVNHHSSTHYNLSTALRQSWGELFYKYSWYIILPILGFPPVMILSQLSISLIYQFWIHTKYIKTLPTWVEYLFNTPAHHRVHHAKNIAYLDKNHAGILIIWDRIFGTFAKQNPKEAVIFGIIGDINTYNPLRIVSHGFVSIWQDLKTANSWGERFCYVFAPPGWSPDGSTQTSAEMQADLEKN